MSSESVRRLWRIAATVFLGAALVLPAAPAAAAQPTSTLSVWIDGWGSGTVTSTPAGINCSMRARTGTRGRTRIGTSHCPAPATRTSRSARPSP